MTDHLTPGLLRDLADMDEFVHGPRKWSKYLREEAARRDAEAAPQHATACEYPHCGCTARHLCKYKVEHEGPGSAASPDDLVMLLRRAGHRGRTPTDYLCYDAAKRIEAQAREIAGMQKIYRERDRAANEALFKLEAAEARVRELDELRWLETGRANAAIADRDAEKARNDRLAAAVKTYLTAKHDLRQANRADDDETYRSALIAYEKSETELQSALTSEGGDRGYTDEHVRELVKWAVTAQHAGDGSPPIYPFRALLDGGDRAKA